MKNTIDLARVFTEPTPKNNEATDTVPPRRLRIVHMVSSLKVGGMEQVVLSLAEAQQSDRHEINIIALNGGLLEEKARQSHLCAHVLKGPGKALRILQTARLLARLKPDIVHVHNPTSLHYAIIGKFVGKTRLLITDHAQTKGIVRMPGALEHRLLDAVVSVSKHTGSESARWGWHRDTNVIHNGVSLVPSSRERLAIRSELGIAEQPVGIMVASLNKVKGHSILLEALASLRDKKVVLTMLIVGGGEERENIESQAQMLNLGADRVRFLGIRSDVADLLAAADFFVLPSLMEGLPLAVLEAMTAGIPVIATPVGGIPELVEDGVNGLLVPTNQSEALANAIISLLNSAQLRDRLGAAGKKKVDTDFTFRHMTSKYERLYYGLCSNKKKKVNA